MKLELLEPGGPDEHLGLSHTLKHYLRPQEMWEDICDDVDPAQRPGAAAGSLPRLTPPAWEQWRDPPASLRGAWAQLEPAYREGYGALILALADALPDPTGDPHACWIRRDFRRTSHAGDGVLLTIRWRAGGWLLHTAYRPMDFRLARHECPPTDSKSVSIRRRLAELAAVRRMAAWRHEEAQR